MISRRFGADVICDLSCSGREDGAFASKIADQQEGWHSQADQVNWKVDMSNLLDFEIH